MNKHNKQYQQLTEGKRYQISALRKTGLTLRAIAREVGVHFATVSRELSRNASDSGYDPATANRLSDARRRDAEKADKRMKKTDDLIKDCVISGWSPEAISLRFEVEFGPEEQLSHTTIYRRLEENKQRGGNLYRYLPRFGKTRWKGGKRNKQAGVRLIPDRTDISERPEIVEARDRLGDWEGVPYTGRTLTW